MKKNFVKQVTVSPEPLPPKPNKATILRLKAVLAVIGLSRATLYQLIKEGRFPKQISLTGDRSVGWLEEDVQNWLSRRISESRGVSL